MPNFLVRPARPEDGLALARLRAALWPESSAEEHFKELEPILAGRPSRILPLIYLVAESAAGGILGFIEAALRSYADGCDPSQPVGYVEGWYVTEEHRRRGIGKALLHAAESWARTQGCKEIASDSELDNATSQRAHQATGFQVVGRALLYRKSL